MKLGFYRKFTEKKVQAGDGGAVVQFEEASQSLLVEHVESFDIGRSYGKCRKAR